MANTKKTKTKGNIFLRMHPVQRVLLSLAITIGAFFIIRLYDVSTTILYALLWDIFSITYITTSWIIFYTRPVEDIEKLANKEDGSRIFVLISVLVASFASMFTVLMLILSAGKSSGQGIGNIILSITGIMTSWVMLHTIFTLHYAHLYYSKIKGNPTVSGLDFPEEKKPDYLDFAYFSFVIGMTFQVSDVQINSRLIRRTALAHGLLAFVLNTFVVALTINLIAGLSK
ncbi:MAG: DUF1345 domain-containing protein [Ferruginibacter sp.]